MPPIVLVYHILVLVWVRNARMCMHLAYPSLLITLLLTVALHKNLFGPLCFYYAFFKKNYYVALPSLNLFLLKKLWLTLALCVLTDG